MQSKIKILQGANTIGGNIVLIEGLYNRLILDFGLPLTDVNGDSLDLKLENHNLEQYLPDIPDLYCENQAKRTLLFLSHAHPDHYALIRFLHPDIPIYCNKITKELIQKTSKLLYKNKYDNLNLLEISKSIETEEFLIEIFDVNHSIAGSSAFKITDKQTLETLLYCGDIRLHGRINPDFESFFGENHNVDFLIIEGTTLSRKSLDLKTELDIENELAMYFKQNKLNLVSFSPLNIDRMISVYNAAKNVGKILVVDPYTAYIIGENNKINYNSDNLEIFCIGDSNTKAIFAEKYYRKIFGKNKIAKEDLIRQPEKYVIKDSWAISEFLSKYHNLNNANLIYSYWSGYMDSKRFHWTKYLSQIVQIHTSGHIDEENLINFVKKINPKKISPIHTISVKRFEQLFGEKVVMF